jgi:uncharacterized membrane protein YozB (DUF420 family)
MDGSVSNQRYEIVRELATRFVGTIAFIVAVWSIVAFIGWVVYLASR